MEEILASIKRVIAEDGRAAFAQKNNRSAEKSEQAEQEPALEDDVLELSNPISDDDRLLSDDSAAASRQSLALLAAMRQQGDSPMAAPMNEGPLEAVVRDMLRPILKDWLDQHLPAIVDDMVAREIARITGKSF